MSGLSFDLIVPIHNSYHVARLCLSSLEQSSNPAETRITCVLDACDDHTIREVTAWTARQPNARHFILQHNLGFVGACNAGMEKATADHIVLVNSDACAPRGWGEKFRACFATDPRIGVASPLSNFCPHNSVPMRPGWSFAEMAELASARSPAYPDITTCEGFFFAVRREMLNQIGYLDGIFAQGYCEESDLCLRANYFGWRTVLVDDCYVFHFGRESFGSATRQIQYDKNKQVFFDRWRGRYAADLDAMKGADAIGAIRRSMADDGVRSAVKWV